MCIPGHLPPRSKEHDPCQAKVSPSWNDRYLHITWAPSSGDVTNRTKVIGRMSIISEPELRYLWESKNRQAEKSRRQKIAFPNGPTHRQRSGVLSYSFHVHDTRDSRQRLRAEICRSWPGNELMASNRNWELFYCTTRKSTRQQVLD